MPNKVVLVSIYIVSRTFFIGTDKEGKLHRYKFDRKDSSLTELSSLPEEQGVDFGRMGKITFLDNILVIIAPSVSQETEKTLHTFIYDAKTGEPKFVENQVATAEFQDLELLQSIHMTINPDNKLLLFDLILNSAVRSVFKVFPLKIVADEKGFAIKTNSENYPEGCSEPFSFFSKPVLMDDIRCLTTEKFVVCFVHSFINGQSGNYFLSWKKYAKCSNKIEPVKLSQDDKKKVSYTYRQTRLAPQSSLNTLVLESYRFNEIIFADSANHSAPSKDHVIRLTKLSGKLAIRKVANPAEDKDFKPADDLSLIFNEVNYWSSQDAKIKPEEWVSFESAATTSKLLMWILIVCGVSVIGVLVFFFYLKKQQ